MRRRGRREIREEELDFTAVSAPLQLGELAITRIEPQRHVRVAARNVVDELLQLERRPVEDLTSGGVQAGNARLERFAEARGAGEPHHAERTAHLVQVLGAAGDRRSIVLPCARDVASCFRTRSSA